MGIFSKLKKPTETADRSTQVAVQVLTLGSLTLLWNFSTALSPASRLWYVRNAQPDHTKPCQATPRRDANPMDAAKHTRRPKKQHTAAAVQGRPKKTKEVERQVENLCAVQLVSNANLTCVLAASAFPNRHLLLEYLATAYIVRLDGVFLFSLHCTVVQQ